MKTVFTKKTDNNGGVSVIIIGGGAAGCLAALTAAEQGASVIILEHNGRLMHKLGITGKGRCNLTNNCGADEVIANLPVNGRFMYGALSRFAPCDTIALFERLGVPLKTERGGRVFPVSDKAADIVNAVKNRLHALDVKIIYDKACEILTDDGTVTGVRGDKACYAANSVILATGGMSYSKTGSTGDGYKIAARLGHTVTRIKPSLVPVITEENCAEMAGLSLKNVKLSLFEDNKPKPIYAEMGEMLFTHEGVSGPLVLSASSFIRDTEEKKYRISLDLKPALCENKLDARILREFQELKNKEIRNAARRLMPESLVCPFLMRCGIDPERRVNEITKEQRHIIIQTLKSFTLNVKSLADIEQAIITDGGVDIREISPATMESRLVKSLYFAGEIIDVTGFTGGFNLQAAFSQAYTAAVAAAR